MFQIIKEMLNDDFIYEENKLAKPNLCEVMACLIENNENHENNLINHIFKKKKKADFIS